MPSDESKPHVPPQQPVLSNAKTVLQVASDVYSETHIRPKKLAAAVRVVEHAVAAGGAPGAVVLVARHGKVVVHQAFGTYNYGLAVEDALPVDAIFDLLSMTKPLTGLYAQWALAQPQLMVDLGATADVFMGVPGAVADGTITLESLLTHTSGLTGLDADIMVHDADPTMTPWDIQLQMRRNMVNATTLVDANGNKVYKTKPTGTHVEYSDLGYRMLGVALENITMMSLDDLRGQTLGYIGMENTFYNPYQLDDAIKARLAGTGSLQDRGKVIDVQDRAFGGMAGCDSAFSTAWDYAIFAQMLLNGGSYGGHQVISPAGVQSLTENATTTIPGSSQVKTLVNRWDGLVLGPKSRGFEKPVYAANPNATNMPYSGSKISPNGWVKAGGAGTFVAVDPDKDLIMIYMTNHGLPAFDHFGYDADGHPYWTEWDDMLDGLKPDEFFDKVLAAIDD